MAAGDRTDLLTVLVMGDAPGHIQAGIQHGHQHALTGIAGRPGLLHVHFVIAVGVPGIIAHIAVLLDRAVIDVLHIGPSDPVQLVNLLQNAIGHLDRHAVDQGGPAGHHPIAGAAAIGSHGGNRTGAGQGSDLIDDALLLIQQLLGSLLGIDRGQELGHGLSGAGSLLRRGIGAGLVVVHDCGSLKLHNGCDQLILVIDCLLCRGLPQVCLI